MSSNAPDCSGAFFMGETMAGRQIHIAPERIAAAKRLYELTDTPVPAIAAMLGIARRTLERRVRTLKWTPRSVPRIEADRAALAAPPEPLAPDTPDTPDTVAAASDAAALRSANAVRIQRLVANSLDAVDRVLAKVGPADEGGAERSARTLAAVARTLQEMSGISQPTIETPHDDDDDDPLPRDIDEIREELARRIHALIDEEESRANGASDHPKSAGDEAVGR